MTKLNEVKQSVAGEWATAWSLRHRANGETYYAHDHAQGSPLYEACRIAHGGQLPDDWVYEVCSEACDALADRDPDEWDEVTLEADYYTRNLIDWLRDHVAEAEEALVELGGGSIMGAIAFAQEKEKNTILAVIREAIEEEAKRRLEELEEAEATGDSE